MMRIALSFATKCPLKDVSAYTMHSCRAFLPHVAEGRRESFERVIEIGKWSGSSVDRADLVPADRLKLKRLK